MSPSRGSAIDPGTQLAKQQDRGPPPLLRQLVATAGIVFNGKRPWDIQVHDSGLYQRIMRKGSLGMGRRTQKAAGTVLSLMRPSIVCSAPTSIARFTTLHGGAFYLTISLD